MPILKVKCPCCQATLDVDQETGELIAHAEARRELKDFDSFLHDQKHRSATLDEKFRAGQEAQARKKELLERKFQAAKEKPIEGDGRPQGPLWD